MLQIEPGTQQTSIGLRDLSWDLRLFSGRVRNIDFSEALAYVTMESIEILV
jgi:hypothetical protein